VLQLLLNFRQTSYLRGAVPSDSFIVFFRAPPNFESGARPTALTFASASPPPTFKTAAMTGKLIRPAPAEIEFKNMRFLITEQPQVSIS
jgi:hypothetical protein